jgi:hypothetical protein
LQPFWLEVDALDSRLRGNDGANKSASQAEINRGNFKTNDKLIAMKEKNTPGRGLRPGGWIEAYFCGS